MRVLVFGTYDVRSHPRVGILAAGLRRHGAEIVECNEPLGIDTATRVAILQQPWRLPLLALRILQAWLALIRRARALPAAPDVVLVGYLGHFDVLLARRLFRRTTIVLDHLISAADTAADRGERGGIKQWLLRTLDKAALRAADVVVVDTEEHRQLLPDSQRDKAVVAAVGAPDAWFAAARPAAEATDGPLRVAFFGLYTPLQGAPVIGRALTEVAGEPIETTMIGQGQDLAATKRAAAANDRVTWLDWVPSDQLPTLVADHDVCLGVFGTGPKALRVVPNKVFQGAAAGCAVITSDSPPQRGVLDGAAVLIPSGDATALAATLRRLAHDRAELVSLRKAAGSLARERFSAQRVVEPVVVRLRHTFDLEISA